jgi:hypothetical protein
MMSSPARFLSYVTQREKEYARLNEDPQKAVNLAPRKTRQMNQKRNIEKKSSKARISKIHLYKIYDTYLGKEKTKR